MASTVGCAPAEIDVEVGGEPGQARREAIVGGAPESDPSVVFVYDRAGLGLCTGTLISPRVVLTAKHCAQRPGATSPLPPAALLVGLGSSIRSVESYVEVERIDTTPGSYTSSLDGAIRGVDVALLTLEHALTISPRAIRRDAPFDRVGDSVQVVGFGDRPGGGVGARYSTMTIVQGLDGDTLVVGAAICEGDSGGPMIEASGQVIGVASFGAGVCGSGYGAFNRLDPFLSMIDEAVGRAGGCVPTGGEQCNGEDDDCDGTIDEECEPLGTPCAFDSSCQGGLCAETLAGRICSARCDAARPDRGCPSAMYCARAGGCEGLCVPGGEGSLGVDTPCANDTDCTTLRCADPGDGRRRCLPACRGDASSCIDGEACLAPADGCGLCVEDSLLVGSSPRGLGEPCDGDDRCASRLCVAQSAGRFCSRVCEDDLDCGAASHCRQQQCVRGPRQRAGGVCEVVEDCEAGLGCRVDGARRICAAPCVEGACPPAFSCRTDAEGDFCAPDAGVLGQSCAAGGICASGLCLRYDGAEVCSQTCGVDAICPAGFRCRRANAGTTAVCLKASVGDGGGGSCSVSSTQRMNGLVVFGAFASVVALTRRRRTRGDR